VEAAKGLAGGLNDVAEEPVKGFLLLLVMLVVNGSGGVLSKSFC
jgi:hypothetical protein